MSAIDRDYWLDFAKEGISKGIESREKAAERLDTFLTWIWSIYTSLFALASLFNYVSSYIWQLVFVAQPILIIVLARYFCTIVSMPSTNDNDDMRADPNDVASIIDSYIIIVEDKKRKLRIAKIMTFISIISVSIALVGYNLFDKNKEIKQDIQTMKLKMELNNQRIKPEIPQQNINDSIRLSNEYYDFQIQNAIKKRKLQCIETGNLKSLDSLMSIGK
jgi:hypothetical protein